jgi:hypothetical protein
VTLHASPALLPRHPRRARAAAIALAAATCATATVVIADAQSAPHARTIAGSSPPAATRLRDIEPNKANSMRALGVATMQNSFASPYRDLEANKARTAQAR